RILKRWIWIWRRWRRRTTVRPSKTSRHDHQRRTRRAELFSASSAGSGLIVVLPADHFQLLPGFLLDVLVQAVAVRVHRDDRWKLLDRQMPHRFGRSEFEQRNAVDARDGARVELRRSADRVQVHAAMLLEGGERFASHPALADDRAHPVPLDD